MSSTKLANILELLKNDEAFNEIIEEFYPEQVKTLIDKGYMTSDLKITPKGDKFTQNILNPYKTDFIMFLKDLSKLGYRLSVLISRAITIGFKKDPEIIKAALEQISEARLKQLIKLAQYRLGRMESAQLDFHEDDETDLTFEIVD